MKVFTYVFKNRLARSLWGNLLLLLFLLLIALVMLLPFVYTISTALKPSNELWLFPPRFFVRHPTTKNISDLFNLMSDSWVPMSRYLFNTVLITVAGTVGHILLASLCAYPLSKYRLPGSVGFFNLVQTTLMYSTAVTAIPSFIVISRLHLLNTYWALILPALSLPLGLFVMKQFMDQTVPMDVLESGEMALCHGGIPLHRFQVRTNGGIRLWVDGVLVLDRPENREPALLVSEPGLDLRLGEKYPLRLEFTCRDGGAPVCELSWMTTPQNFSPIPARQLYPSE